LSRLLDARHPGAIHHIASARPPANLFSVVRRKLQNLLHPYPEWLAIRDSALPLYTHEAWRMEMALCKAADANPPDLIVVEGADEHFYKVAAARSRWPHTRLIGINHQTPGWLRLHQKRLDVAKALDALVVFSSEAKAFWDPILGSGKTHLLHHGVVTEFFCPAAKPAPPAAAPLRVIFCGYWLRDFRTLTEVARAVETAGHNIVFDLVVPYKARETESMYRLARSPLVRWHAGLTDEDLRDLYRQSDLVLLPLLDATANNALLEGMACGLPIVATDVGGVRDYVTPEFADLVPPDDPGAIVALLARYVSVRSTLAPRGQAARRHAETMLPWTETAARFDALLHALAAPAQRP
jgi:glycosyltransferase involved in cell wall biosynthesis